MNCIFHKKYWYDNQPITIISELFYEGKLHKTDTIIKEISIRDDNQQYTSEFIQLLKDYYLHL